MSNYSPLTIILLVLFLIVSFFSAYKFFYLEKKVGYDLVEENIDLNSASLFYGSKKFEKKIILFSDYSCIYCKNLTTKLTEIIEKNDKKIAIYIYHFPLNQVGYNASLASECAKDQIAFYDIHEKFFEFQDSILASKSFTFENILDLINEEKFNNCIISKGKEKIIDTHINVGRELNLIGVPKLIVEGKMYSGDIDKKVLKDIILTN